MKARKRIAGLVVVAFILCMALPVFSELGKCPPQVAAVFIAKLAGFQKNLPSDITIYVMGDPGVAAEMRKGIGKKIGSGTLSEVTEGEDLPQTKPSILYVGNPGKVDEAIGYTRSNKILSVTGHPDLVAKGVTLGVGIGDDKKPRIMLNLSSSVEENLDWNPAIMKVAKTIK